MWKTNRRSPLQSERNERRFQNVEEQLVRIDDPLKHLHLEGVLAFMRPALECADDPRVVLLSIGQSVRVSAIEPPLRKNLPARCAVLEVEQDCRVIAADADYLRHSDHLLSIG